MHVRNHTNDFADWRLARLDRSVRRDPFANWVFTWKKLFGETFGYDRHRRSGVVVAVAKRATTQQRNAHRFEIIRRYDVELHDRLLPWWPAPFLAVPVKANFTPAHQDPPGRGG